MVEAAPRRILCVERILAGMPERRVAEIMDQRYRLGEILVAAQRARQGAGDLRHLDRVGEPGAVVIALVGDEHLRLVLQPRNAVEWMMRSRSRWNGVRVGLSGSP